MIKTKTGLSDEYIKQITGTVKPVYDEEKKQKIILDYKILNGEASDPHDFNILILVEYPNMAAFDSLRDKMDPVIAKVMGSEEQQRDQQAERPLTQRGKGLRIGKNQQTGANLKLGLNGKSGRGRRRRCFPSDNVCAVRQDACRGHLSVKHRRCTRNSRTR